MHPSTEPAVMDAPLRLEVLQSVDLIDRPTDRALQDLVELVAELTGSAVVVLSLVGSQQVHHLARVGWLPEQTPYAQAYCSLAIECGDWVEVADVRVDPRFAQVTPAEGGPSWRHYAAQVLMLDGVAVGTLCVMDEGTTLLSSAARAQLQRCAKIACSALAQRRQLYQLQLQAGRLHDLARASGDWMWELDEQLRCNWISGDFEAATGSGTATALNRQLDDEPLVDALGQPVVPARGLRELLSQRMAFSRVLTRFDAGASEVRYLSRSAVPVFDADGLFRGYRGTTRNVTAGIVLEQQMQERALLQRDKEAAERISQARSAFLSRVSHELRTPMNAVLGFAQLMTQDTEQPLQGLQAQRLTSILRAGRSLMAQIDDLLEIAELQRGARTLRTDAVPLAPLVLRCLAKWAAEAQVAEVVLQTEVPEGLLALADAEAVAQVLDQLVSNAIRYNRPGGRVRVSAAIAPAGLIELTVQDDGPGLAPQGLQQLFTPFAQPAGPRALTGTGLGLVLVRELVVRMHGHVTAHSELGVGTRLTVALPVAPNSVAGTPAERAPVPSSARVHQVLYIEDEPLNVVLMQEIFRGHAQWQLHVARDGGEGVEMARTLRPDLALVDMNLPDFNGLEVLRQLRADELTRAMPCIALSADAMVEQIETALAAGFDDYWTKPIDLAGLMPALARAVGGPAG
jgi:signal transduction histidine kinase/ActR/RegA family two-component response regulator